MKLPNDIIKSTDLEKAKDRIIHEFECIDGKFVHHYALGGEHILTNQEIVDCLNGLATIDCDLQTAYAYIKGQEQKLLTSENLLIKQEKEYDEQLKKQASIHYRHLEEKDNTIKTLVQDSESSKKLLKHQIAVLENALKLACETFCSGSHPEMRLEVKNFTLISGVEKYFKSQAEKEVESL